MTKTRFILASLAALLSLVCLWMSILAAGDVSQWLQKRFSSIEIFALTLFPPTGWLFLLSTALLFLGRSQVSLIAGTTFIAVGIVTSWYTLFLIGSN